MMSDAFGQKESGENGRKKTFFLARIVSLALAFVIWVYVVNVTTENYEKTFDLIDISLEGTEKLAERQNMTVFDMEEGKVRITVSGLRSDINSLTAEDFFAYIDVSELTSGGKQSCEVKVNVPNSVQVVERSPANVVCNVDVISEKTVPVKAELLSYNLMNSAYRFGDLKTEFDSVTLRGPQTVLDRIEVAKAPIELGNVSSGMEKKVKLVLENAAGDAVDSRYVSFDNEYCAVKIPVEMQKTVAVAADIRTSGVTSAKLSCENLVLKGDPTYLEKLDVVYAVITSETREGDTISVALPDGVFTAEGETVVKLTVTELVPETADSGGDTANESDAANKKAFGAA